MASHRDDDHDVSSKPQQRLGRTFEELVVERHRLRCLELEARSQLYQFEQKAEELSSAGQNTIAAGRPLEPTEQMLDESFLIARLPADPLALRISIGEPLHELLRDRGRYLRFRGDPRQIVRLLREACAALERVISDPANRQGRAGVDPRPESSDRGAR